MTPEELKKHMEDQAKAAAELRTALEKKADADQVAKIQGALDKYEELNQKLALAEQKAKAAKDHAEELEAKFNRVQLGAGGGGEEKAEVRAARERKEAFFAYSRRGTEALSAEERKALVTSDDTGSGYLSPAEFVLEIIKGAADFSPIRSIARVRPIGGRSAQFPKKTGDVDADWVDEIEERKNTTPPAYGLEEITAHEVIARVPVSNAMLEDSLFDLEAELREGFTTAFAKKEGASFVSGNGKKRPAGFLVNAGTAGYVQATNSGSAATVADADGQANGIIALFHAVKEEYAKSGVWVLNRTTLGKIRSLKDANKQHIWLPGIAQGNPNTILGAPYIVASDMPDEGANAFPVAFGDFRRAYTIVDRLQMAMLRDAFTLADYGQVKFVARKRVGGQVVLAEAIRVLKCAT